MPHRAMPGTVWMGSRRLTCEEAYVGLPGFKGTTGLSHYFLPVLLESGHLKGSSQSILKSKTKLSKTLHGNCSEVNVAYRISQPISTQHGAWSSGKSLEQSLSSHSSGTARQSTIFASVPGLNRLLPGIFMFLIGSGVPEAWVERQCSRLLSTINHSITFSWIP